MIGGHLSLSPNLVVILVDRLSARNLVERNDNPANRREKIVTLTDYGREIMLDMDQSSADLNYCLPTGVYSDFIKAGKKIIENVETRNSNYDGKVFAAI